MMDRRGAASPEEKKKTVTGPERRSLSAQRRGGAATHSPHALHSPRPSRGEDSKGPLIWTALVYDRPSALIERRYKLCRFV